MAKATGKNDKPAYARTLREYITALERNEANKQRLETLRPTLACQLCSEASKFNSISPERRVMLQMALELVPDEDAASTMQERLEELAAAKQQQQPARAPRSRDEAAA